MMPLSKVTCTIRRMLDTGKPTSAASGVDVRLTPQLAAALGTLAQTIEQFAAKHSIGGEITFRLNLVLDELVTNSVNYALPQVEEPELRVRLLHTPEGVVAQLEDNGAAFDPFQDAPVPATDQALDDRPIGGLGVFFVTQFTDSASYERNAGVNRITLRMRLET